MKYEELIEKVLDGKTVNLRAKELGIPQKTLWSYAEARTFPDCATTVMMAKVAKVKLEDAVLAIAKKQLEVQEKKQHVKVALDKLAVSFNTLLHVANVGWKRVSPTV